MNSIALDPTKPRRWRIDDHGTEFVVTIPRLFSLSTSIALPALLIIVFLFGSYLSNLLKLQGIPLAIAVLALLGMSKDWLWNLGGVEILTFTNETLLIRREILGIGWTRRVPFSRISGFSYERIGSYNKSYPAIKLELVTPSGVGLPIPGTKILFGKYLGFSEANDLLDIIENRFPKLLKLTPDS